MMLIFIKISHHDLFGNEISVMTTTTYSALDRLPEDLLDYLLTDNLDLQEILKLATISREFRNALASEKALAMIWQPLFQQYFQKTMDLTDLAFSNKATLDYRLVFIEKFKEAYATVKRALEKENALHFYLNLSDELKNDKELVKVFVRQNGLYQQHLPESLKNNPEILLEALSSDARALPFTSVELENDIDILAYALTTGLPFNNNDTKDLNRMIYENKLSESLNKLYMQRKALLYSKQDADNLAAARIISKFLANRIGEKTSLANITAIQELRKAALVKTILFNIFDAIDIEKTTKRYNNKNCMLKALETLRHNFIANRLFSKAILNENDLTFIVKQLVQAKENNLQESTITSIIHQSLNQLIISDVIQKDTISEKNLIKQQPLQIKGTSFCNQDIN